MTSEGSCPRCGAVEIRRVETSRAAALRNWLAHGTRVRGEQQECARCGARWVALTYGWRNHRPTALGAPWRVVQVLRRHRSQQPVPVFYVGVLVVGTVVGIGLQLVAGVPWWLAPVAALAAAWLAFLSSAFRGVRAGDLLLDVKVALRPHRASQLHRERTEHVFRHAPFPLFGLAPGWPGDRWLGGFGTTNGQVSELALGHSDERPQGRSELVVAVRRGRDQADPHDLRLAALELEAHLGRPPRSWSPDAIEPPWPDLDSWPPLPVAVDGVVVEFRAVTEGDRWVAIGVVGGLIVSFQARRFPIEQVSIVTVSDVEPYVRGSRS